MWIFGYGSLMFDGWEKEYNPIKRHWADLAGYQRAFNKKSVESRGTKEAPGLTLNLEQVAGSVCHGVAFEFKDNDRVNEMKDALRVREACGPSAVAVSLEGGEAVAALTYIYRGKNLLAPDTSLQNKADMVRAAKGIRGTGLDYVRTIYEGLDSIGVRDPAVTELWEAVKADAG